MNKIMCQVNHSHLTLTKDIDIISFVRRFSNVYRRHFDLVSKYIVELKTLLLQALSEPEFYGDFVRKLRNIMVKMVLLIISKRHMFVIKMIGYNILVVLPQTACLVLNSIMVNNFAYVFDCTTVGRACDWMTVPS